MAAEMPERVEPVSGAHEVDFPWSEAEAVVEALNVAASVLGSQLETRPGMIDTLVDWQGRYRLDFDEADDRIRVDTAPPLKEELVRLASSIVSGAENANQDQRDNNARADDDPQAPVPVSRGSVR